MADRAISALPTATTLTASDLFVLSQSNQAKNTTWQTIIGYLTTALDGHGGIQSITYTPPVLPSLDGTLTITLADSTHYDVTVTNGNGVNGVVQHWAVSSSDSTTPSTWYTTMQTMTSTNKYLWNYMTLEMDDGNDIDTTPCVAGVYGDTGQAWYVWIRYAGSQPTSDSDIGTTPDDWIGVYSGTESDPDNLHYTDFDWFQYKGATGATGAAATITTQNVSYQASNSGTVAPSGSWTTTIPTVPQGSFLWTRTQLAFNDGTTVTAYSVSRYGIDGTGAVSTVNGVSPDGSGNVAITASDIAMSDNQSIETNVTQLQTDVGDVSNLTTSASTVVPAINELKTALDKVRKRNYILIGDSFSIGITPNVSEANWKGWSYWFEQSFGSIYTIHHCTPNLTGVSGFASSLPFEDMLSACESDYASFADEVTDIVVLGGTNDSIDNETNIKAAIASFCSYCATTYPNATVRIGCLGSNFDKMYSMGQIYQYCTECGAIYMPDGRALYSDTDYISSDGTHLTQAGYAYYKEYTNNLIASGHCHFSFNKETPITVTCGTLPASTTYNITMLLTENTISMNVVPAGGGTNIVVNSTTIPQIGHFQFASFTSPFKNIPGYVGANYIINGLNLHRGSDGGYAIYGTITLVIVTQASPTPKMEAFINSMGTFSNGSIRGGCAACVVPY